MRKMINNIASVLEGVTTAAIAGHVRPDGDCVGSCMGMYLYLKENYPQIQTDVYLEEVPEVFHFIQDIDQAKQEWEEKEYDLCILFYNKVSCSDGYATNIDFLASLQSSGISSPATRSHSPFLNALAIDNPIFYLKFY